MKVKNSINKKFAIVFVAMAILIAIGIGFFTYSLSYEQVINQYEHEALRVARVVAQLSLSDSFDAYLSAGADSTYYALYEELKSLKKIYNLKHLYIFRPYTEINDGVYIFDILVEGDDEELIADLGDETGEIDIYDFILNIFLTGCIENNTVITDSQYGYLASAYAPVYTTDGRITAIAGVDIEMDVILNDVRVQAFHIIGVTLGSIMLSLIILMIILHIQVIKPTLYFSRYLQKYVSGNDNLQEIEVKKTGDEFQIMNESFNHMVKELRLYMKNLEETTADRERIATELNVATQIQANMLPSIFPAFPEREEFDIFACMLPAKEVGGDFYDFFMVDEDTLAVVIADVSGKGVPAALFMVIAKTLIKNNSQYGQSPKEVFETVNNMLCENNDAGMFVTAFMGYLDIPSGKLTFVNAGHNPPLYKKGGEFRWLETKRGFVLAGMEDMFYKQGEIYLEPGDKLFLYTDGVTEAVNNEQELFSDPRLLETINNYTDAPLKELVVSLKREIDNFAEGAEQADDITMLILKFTGEAATE